MIEELQAEVDRIRDLPVGAQRAAFQKLWLVVGEFDPEPGAPSDWELENDMAWLESEESNDVQPTD